MQQLSTDRQDQIERFIREHRRATVVELSQFFKVSEPTIRRDLEKLESSGKVRRSHGGALALESAAPEPPVLQRLQDCAEEKYQIGQAAAHLVRDGETIFLGSGTTTLEVARNLTFKKNLTVITNALTVANQLAGNENINLIVTGGVLRHSEASLTGHLVEQTLKELRADKVIISIRSISIQEGLTSDDFLETMTDRAILGFARQVILVADHTKFDKTSTVRVAPITAVQTIVTGDKVPAETVRQIQELGIEVIQANTETT
ncbi:MAG: DeoR/GlpR transcriptional regulator [Chloroflexi bacterium]|jgi:DeoR/GlpR family transcriptional regulator of sugar metabolism|nr:DeoR/GlpR transcriptional regulator [Chloroflexota bacterium]